MFCTQCGIQIDQGANFCKNCGTRVNKTTDPVVASEACQGEPTIKPVETSQRTMLASPPDPMDQQIPFSPSHERKGISTTRTIAIVVILVLATGAGVYFGTDLLRPPAKQEPAGVAETPSTRRAEAPGPTPWENAKKPNEAANNNLAAGPQSQEPVPAEPPQPATLPKPGPGSARTNKPPVAAPASRRSAAGTYETNRSTPVFDSPSASAAVVANIPGGVRVTVVGAKGDWLEVHSKRGNPPGFIRRGDAKFVEKSE
jgi:hypothetical protein